MTDIQAQDGVTALFANVNGLDLPIVKISDLNRSGMSTINNALIAPDDLWHKIEKQLVESLET